jgi:hypothetical protein
MSDAWKRSIGQLVGRGAIAPIHCEGHEIIRRIFVTVRDRNWQEVAPSQWNVEVAEAQRTARISARHTSEHVDFEWTGTLSVSSDHRTARFAFHGRALRDMNICRLGLVVLHPVESMLGAALSVTHDETSIGVMRVAEQIAPQPIIDGVPGAMTEPFTKLRIERADFGTLELRFSGDQFEIEDQRNWGDASFKTYCTPLRKGFPRAVRAGTSISHSVEAQFAPSSVRAGAFSARALETTAAPVRRLFPLVGRQWSGPDCMARSGDPSWRYLSFHLTDSSSSRDDLEKVFESSAGRSLEIATEAFTERGPSDTLQKLLSRYENSIMRLLLYGSGGNLPSADAVDRWHRILNSSPALRDLPVLSATRGYFVEFNRSLPLTASVAGIAFPLTATVHSDDLQTIVDNVPTIHDIAATARSLTRPREISLSPLALYYPESGPQRAFPSGLAQPWLIASLLQAALAGVTSVTIAEDALDEARSSLLSELVELAGTDVRALGVPLPAGVHAAVIGESGRVLAVNLNPCAIELEVAEKRIELTALSARWISDPGAGHTQTFSVRRPQRDQACQPGVETSRSE